jgi:hypothetical protein
MLPSAMELIIHTDFGSVVGTIAYNFEIRTLQFSYDGDGEPVEMKIEWDEAAK